MEMEDFFRSHGRVHFIGCGGAGTQPLALIFHEMGIPCSGSDLIENDLTKALNRKGIRTFTGHRKENLPPEDGRPLLIVYTSAAAGDNPELIEAKRRGIPCLRRGEALAGLAKLFPVRIAVSGSHGKTSVTAMIACALKTLGLDPGFLVGGTVRSWETCGSAGGKKILVSEVDESDSTNALFSATLGIVTNLEDDHAWSVGGKEKLFDSFRTFAGKAEKLLYVSGTCTDEVLKDFSGKAVILPPGFPPKNDLYPADWGGFFRKNAETAIAAIRIVFPELDETEIRKAVLAFPGVERRMCERYRDRFCRVVDDYAHHPTELAASLSSLRETDPGKRLVIVFQPHRFARLERYFDDFVRLLSTADQVFIPPVFAAWSDSSSVNSEKLASAVGSRAKALSGSWKEMAECVAKATLPNSLIGVIGAGDVKEILSPLASALARKNEFKR